MANIPDIINQQIQERFDDSSVGRYGKECAIFGYQVAEKEIERLKGILEKAVKQNRWYEPFLPPNAAWNKFKTDNNL